MSLGIQKDEFSRNVPPPAALALLGSLWTHQTNTAVFGFAGTFLLDGDYVFPGPTQQSYIPNPTPPPGALAVYTHHTHHATMMSFDPKASLPLVVAGSVSLRMSYSLLVVTPPVAPGAGKMFRAGVVALG